MSLTDVGTFVTDIDNAAIALNSTGAADLNDLAAAIKILVDPGTNAARCFIFNNTIPQ
jgi:hypothetical protein